MAGKSSDDEGGLLEAVWRVIRRRWPIILASIVVCTALAYALSASQPKQYTATAGLLFGTTSENILNIGAYVDPERAAATNESLLGLSVVSEEAARLVEGPATARQIRNAVEIVSGRQGNVVEVQATTTDPERSAEFANAYARGYIALRQRTQQEQIQAAIDLARRGQAAMTEAETEGPEGQALADRINQLEQAKTFQMGGAELVQEAAAPTTASAPQPTRSAILGLMLGAVLGFVIAALLERADRAYKDVDELEKASGWPVLARVPSSRRLERGAALSSQSAESEAYRMLRASLRYFSVDAEIRSLLITSARSGEGKSTTSRRLADVMATMGDQVVLVEADMHRGGQGGRAVGDEGRGLSGYLIGHSLDEVLVEMPVGTAAEDRTLSLLPSGPLPPNPTELLESDRMHHLMAELHDRFDIVLIDSPPLPVLSDAVTLLEHVSGILVVTAVGTTTDEDIQDVKRLMTLHGGTVLGMVANFAPDANRLKGYYGEESSEPKAGASRLAGIGRLKLGSNGRA